MYHVALYENKNVLPKIIKSYPHYLQCKTWVTLKGFVYTAKGRVWLDPSVIILFDRDDLIEKGTNAWKDTDDDWLENHRGNIKT